MMNIFSRILSTKQAGQKKPLLNDFKKMIIMNNYFSSGYCQQTGWTEEVIAL